MSVYTPLANQIAGLLVISALLALGGYRALHTAWVVRRTIPQARRHITQRNRYMMTALGLGLTVPMIYVFVRFGIDACLQTLNLMIKADPTFGWPVFIVAALAAFYVPIAWLGVTCMIVWPSPFAYRKGNLYAPTAWHRAGNTALVPWIKYRVPAVHAVTISDPPQIVTVRPSYLASNADHYDACL